LAAHWATLGQQTELAPSAADAMVSARYEVNKNNIAGAVAAPEASTHAVRFLGAKRSAEECEQACVHELPAGGCTSFTWHHADFDGGAWARGCYARTDGVWQPVRQQRVTCASLRPLPCRTALDCSLNGRCVAAACLCSRGWTGHHCERLKFGATPRAAGFRHATARFGPLTSWGGAVLQDDDGTFHMWASVLTARCSMHYWLANSQVVHATTASLTAPFEMREVVWPVFAHEPNVVRAPSGEYVMFFTSTPRWRVPPTRAGRQCVCDRQGAAVDADCTGERDWSAPLQTYMSFARSPHGGNWSTPVPIPQAAPLVDTNLAPVILADGSLLGLFRDNGNFTNLHIVHASDWRDASTYVESATPISGGVAGNAPRAAKGMRRGSSGAFTRAHRGKPSLHRLLSSGIFDGPEDPFVWRDNDGHFHALFHEYPYPGGAHAFSPTGKKWFYAAGGSDGSGFCTETPCAFTNSLELLGGGTLTLSQRERPHLVFDQGGTPLALTNGACGPTRTHCWTALQLVDG